MLRGVAIAAVFAATGCDLVFGLSGGGGADDQAQPDGGVGVDGPAMKCFSDDFADGVLDVGVWTGFGASGPPAISEVDGDFVVTLVPSTAAYYGQTSAEKLDIGQEGDGVVVKITEVASQTGCVETSVALLRDETTFVVLVAGGGTFLARKYTDGVVQLAEDYMTPWNPLLYQYWQIRRNAALDIEFLTSMNGSDWDLHHTMRSEHWLSESLLRLYAGAWCSNTMPGEARFAEVAVASKGCLR